MILFAFDWVAALQWLPHAIGEVMYNIILAICDWFLGWIMTLWEAVWAALPESFTGPAQTTLRVVRFANQWFPLSEGLQALWLYLGFWRVYVPLRMFMKWCPFVD